MEIEVVIIRRHLHIRLTVTDHDLAVDTVVNVVVAAAHIHHHPRPEIDLIGLDLEAHRHIQIEIIQDGTAIDRVVPRNFGEKDETAIMMKIDIADHHRYRIVITIHPIHIVVDLPLLDGVVGTMIITHHRTITMADIVVGEMVHLLFATTGMEDHHIDMIVLSTDQAHLQAEEMGVVEMKAPLVSVY